MSEPANNKPSRVSLGGSSNFDETTGSYTNGSSGKPGAVPEQGAWSRPNRPRPWQNRPRSVKAATPDIIEFKDDEIDEEEMLDLVFETIGGREILSVVRSDIINGQSVTYSPIKNLSELSVKYDSKNILPLQNASNVYFYNFPINLENCVPSVGTGPNGEVLYIDSSGSLIIDVINLKEDESVEVQILTTGEILDDTIY